MITKETDLYNYGSYIGWRGGGSANCPNCGRLTDIGTGEHAKPDAAKCSCGKWFRYWPSGRTQKISAKFVKILQLS